MSDGDHQFGATSVAQLNGTWPAVIELAGVDFQSQTQGNVGAARVCDPPGTGAADLNERARWVSTLRRVEAQARAAERLLSGGADCAEIAVRLVGMMKSLRSLGAEVSAKHVRHCTDHRLAHGVPAGAAATAELVEAIRQLVHS